MAAGDFYIRNNAAETTSITTANYDSTWDGLVVDVGSIVTYSAGSFQVDTGLYLVMYSEKFDTSDTTNNERIEIQGEIIVGGSSVMEGRGQDYIRKSSGQQSCVVSGAAIIDVTSDNTDIDIRFYRTDNSTTGTVDRVPGNGGVQILQLDDNDNYAFYSKVGTQSITTTEASVSYDTNDRQDTGFTRTGSAVDIANAGRYLVSYSMDLNNGTGTSRTEAIGFIELNSTRVNGTRASCYMRGSDGTNDGALNWIGIIDVAAGDDLTVQVDLIGGATTTIAAGAVLQIWQIPSAGDECIMEATNGAWNTAGDFAFDTLPHIDTASFTATAGTSIIQTDQTDHLLVFGTMSQDAPDGVQRAYPELRISVNNSTQNYTAGGYYHRNSGGIGAAAATVCGIAHTVPTSGDIEINITPTSAAGTMTNDSAQFSVLSLESVFGPYTFPPAITDAEDEQIDLGETNIVLDGERFGSVQGTGKVELVENSDYTGTIVVQTIDTWSDTQIQFDSVQGALLEGTVFIFVTTDSGSRSAAYQVNLGEAPYATNVQTLTPDHYWELDNSYDDSGNTDDRPMITDIVGGGAFNTTTITRSSTHCWYVNSSTIRRGCADTNQMNLQTETARTMGGWIRLGEIPQDLVGLYKEGGSVNNLAFLIGFGGVLLAQLADTSDDNVQAFSDFRLVANRDYHILFVFDYGAGTPEFRLYIDGVLQSVTAGNPLTATDLDSHSGDINWADFDTNLEVGGTDILFNGPGDCRYAHWATWTTALTSTQIRETLFELGAKASVTLASDTEANMQTALDAYADTVRPNEALSIKIPGSSSGNFELTADNIVFDDSTSIQVQYTGPDVLTWVNSNGSNLTASKVSTTGSGSVVIEEAPTLTVTVQDISGTPIQNARVRMVAASGGPLVQGTEILTGLTNVSGQISTSFRYSSNQPVTGISRKASSAPYYKTGSFSGTITSSGLSVTVFMIEDQ